MPEIDRYTPNPRLIETDLEDELILLDPTTNLADRTLLGVLRQGDLPAVIAAVRVLKSGADA